MSLWLIPIIFLFGLMLPQALAYSSYGIILDQSCLTMLRNNVSSNCPSYDIINSVFPDTSNRKILGDFGYKDGIYQRLSSQYSDPTGYYRYGNDNLIFIDPPAKLYQSINLITIRANLDEYLFRGKNPSYDQSTHSLTLGHDRYMAGCAHAYIDSENWLFLLGDTFQYMKNNCDPKFTNYNSTKTTYLNKVTHDLTTSYKYKLEKWIKQSLERCGHNICIYGKNQTAPP